jgi:prevent-host-death family protein
MRKVGSREFKNRLGQYLAAVRKGQSLLITDRGRPVAKLIPADPEETPADPLRARLLELEAQGLIRLPKRPMRSFKAVPSRGKLASEMIIEDRQ